MHGCDEKNQEFLGIAFKVFFLTFGLSETSINFTSVLSDTPDSPWMVLEPQVFDGFRYHEFRIRLSKSKMNGARFFAALVAIFVIFLVFRKLQRDNFFGPLFDPKLKRLVRIE